MTAYTAELAGCYGKRAFESFTLARARADLRRDGKRPRVAYRCRYCGKVHIGERDIQRERADRRRRSEQTREDANAD